jgi:hypothetical protein
MSSIQMKPPRGAYDAIVITQETDVWADDPYGRSLTPTQEAGIADAGVINSAISLLGLSDTKKIDLFGTFTIREKILIPRSNLIIDGCGSLFQRQVGVNDNEIFSVEGEVGSSISITSTDPVGDKTIALASVVGLVVGQVIDVWELNSEYYHMLNRIEAPLKYGTIGGISVVYPFSALPENITIQNARFLDSTPVGEYTEYAAINCSRAANIHLRNLRFDFQRSCPIVFNYVRDGLIENFFIDGVYVIPTSQPYGILTSMGTSNIVVSNGQIYRATHATTGQMFGDIIYNSIIAVGNPVSDATFSFDGHPYSIDLSYVNCHSRGAPGGFLVNGKNVSISNCSVVSPTNHGVYVSSTASNVDIHGVRVSNINAAGGGGNTRAGFYISGSHGQIHDCKVFQEVLTTPTHQTVAFQFVGNAQDWLVTHPIITDDVAELLYAIYVQGNVSGVHIHGGQTSGTYSKVRQEITASNLQITDFECDDVFVLLGSGNVIKRNKGHLTENSGSSTGTGSEQTIAHSLAAIPTGCKAWIKYLVNGRYITEMIPFDATNVYPTVTSGLAYEWRIE